MRPSCALAAFLCCVCLTACDRKSDIPENPADIAKEAPVTAKTSPEMVHQQSSLVSADTSTVTDFDRRLKEFIVLRDKAAGGLTKLPDQATPKQIDVHQRDLAAAVSKARASARQGDVFMPAMQKYIRGVVQRVLGGPEGGNIKASLMDENPMKADVRINARYPDTVPMSTMPPDVLAALPTLTDDLEYRFVGNRLVLLDIRSHLIIDFVTDTFAL